MMYISNGHEHTPKDDNNDLNKLPTRERGDRQTYRQKQRLGEEGGLMGGDLRV